MTCFDVRLCASSEVFCDTDPLDIFLACRVVDRYWGGKRTLPLQHFSMRCASHMARWCLCDQFSRHLFLHGGIQARLTTNTMMTTCALLTARVAGSALSLHRAMCTQALS
jgi:hypothetical protein